MIWSVVVTYEAAEEEAAIGIARDMERLLEEVWAVSVSEVAEVAPLVQFDEEENPHE